jgi:NADPH:quinone reductase-like Zn-dependent oxidoreductase
VDQVQEHGAAIAVVGDGRLRPVVSQTFPLREGRLAFESAGRPRPPGKTVLVVR